MIRVVVIGGGLSGCGAAIAAQKAGADVTLLERTDMLAGVAVRTGDTRGNGWFTGQHELRFMGGGEIFDTLESVMIRDGVKFPDHHNHGYLFHAGLFEPALRKTVHKAGVKVMLESRAVDVVKDKGRIKSVKLDSGASLEANAFVDCTGARGGLVLCNKYAKGCVMCLVKCPIFGDRVSITEKAGAKEWFRVRGDGTPGRISTGLSVYKDTLSPALRERLRNEGLVWLAVPPSLVDLSKLGSMGAGRSREFVENLILGDIGLVAKIFGFLSITLAQLRQIPGFENVQIEHPSSPRTGHVSAIAIAYRDRSFKVDGVDNLFCAGDKAGETSVDAAMVSGYLAGNNAARQAAGEKPLILPQSLAVGDWVAVTTEKYRSGEGVKNPSWVMSRGEYWERMQKLGLYTSDVGNIKKRVKEAGMAGVLEKRVG